MPIRIDVRAPHAADQSTILAGARTLGIPGLDDCRIVRLYFIEHELANPDLQKLCDWLLVDPVMEQASWQALGEPGSPNPRASNPQGPAANAQPGASPHIVEVTFRPGVTDVPARELMRGMAEIGLDGGEVVTGTRYELHGTLDEPQLRRLAGQLLCNETVQHFSLGPITPHFGVEAAPSDAVEQIPIAGLDDQALQTMSRTRLLSLDLAEMRAIQDFYVELGRDPTDVELETLAQTWSEHCVHKTFRARIDFSHQDAQGAELNRVAIDGLLRTFLRAATDAVHPDWLRSAFVDNAGIVAFDEEYDLAFKVETHNHPSALEPFGGANTGVGGVVRDILGVSARPIANTNVLCFGPQDFPNHDLPQGLLHPRRIAAGVVAGIGDYGNKLGLPTVNGAVLYDPGYLGNPLVFCGCAGILPRDSHPTEPQEGDQVVVIGGRTGRDGLHGATFSSAELTHDTSETAGTAVQIGDPITEKGLIELIEAARTEGLYHAITDCGAGGLSSAVGEMGADLGVDVELTHVALKYPGLVPWEIWLSEAQERMVLAVPPEQIDRLRELATLWEVEMSVLGEFTGGAGSGARWARQLIVRYNGRPVAQLPMAFVHDGLPQRTMQAIWQEPPQEPPPAIAESPDDILVRMLTQPTIATKESIVRTYDHEVRGGTVVRPFGGPEMDGPNDAAVLKPLQTWRHGRAFALSAGVNPQLGRRDPYAMAVSAVDEAVRNAVAVGADPDQLAILDNFCWGNPTLPDRLGSLVRACQGCYDGALAYRAPYISGKDSLYNEFNGTPIPGTLLISALALVPDMERTVTAACKAPGNRLYLMGDTQEELGGSLLHELYGSTAGTAPALPDGALGHYRALHKAMRQGLVRSCHDCSEGGLAVALAEMAVGGRLGMTVDTPARGLSAPATLFAESNGRLVCEVTPKDASAFEAVLQDAPLTFLGEVTQLPQLVIKVDGAPQVQLGLETLVDAWHGRAPAGRRQSGNHADGPHADSPEGARR